MDFFRELDAPALDELVIAVPKFYLPRIPQRCPRRRPRKAEQLVEVPTIISYSSLQQRIAEQLIDIPVPHDRGGRGGGRGLQGFSQGQGATAFRGAEFVDTPVPPGRGGWVGHGGLLRFSQGQNSTADLEQNVDIPARGDLHGFLPGQSSSSSSRLLDNADEGIQGVFALFPVRKKCDVGSALGVGTECGLYSVHSGCLCGLYWAADGSLGGSRSLAGGSWTGTLLFGGTLLGDVVAAAGSGVCGAVPGLDGRRPCCAGRPADGWKWSFPVAVHRQVVDVLGGVLVAEGWGGGRRF